MNNIDTYLNIIKAEMVAEYTKTIDGDFIKNIVLRAGGKVSEIENILKHPSVKKIDEDLFYIDTSIS